MTNVKSYTDSQILERVKSLPNFKAIPSDFWLVGIRSNEDSYNRFDDKAYLFEGEKFIYVYPITTNAGTDLLNPSNAKGEAVLKADEIYYDSWIRGRHRNKVEAYVQYKNLPVYRDKNQDTKSDEKGVLDVGMFGINIHPSSYVTGNKEAREFIGVWSQGCQVFSVRSDFDIFMGVTKGQKLLTYCLLREW